jgi:predicted nucleic acid-binding protein
MRFWDSSAIVPLLLNEPKTQECRRLIADDPELTVWWCSRIECASAIERRQREGTASSTMADAGYQQLEELATDWSVVAPSDALAQTAIRLLRVHELRAADAMQLAAAISSSLGDPASLPFVCLDQRLRDAASREGFPLVPQRQT